MKLSEIIILKRPPCLFCIETIAVGVNFLTKQRDQKRKHIHFEDDSDNDGIASIAETAIEGFANDCASSQKKNNKKVPVVGKLWNNKATIK